MFSDDEKAYLRSQHLARIATVSSEGQPDVAPVGFRFDGVLLSVSGRHIETTLKYKNAADGNKLVAIVVDDLKSFDPWRPRGVKVHGTVEIIDSQPGSATYLKITPHTHWSWGIEGSSQTLKRTDWS